MISVSNIHKSYGETKVLEGLSFSVEQGEVLGFLGPNGAGKTTTMRIITGFLTATSGDVTIDGVSVQQDSLKTRSRIGYLPESNPLYDTMRVYEYLEYVARMKGLENAQQAIAAAVKQTQLEDKLTYSISELSKGYKQRVGLADALLGNPDILILDEPTSGLDPNQALQIRELIAEIGKTKTVIFSTHILQEVQAACDRAIIIHNGAIVAQGTVEELTNQSEGKMTIELVIDGPDAEVVKALEAIEGVEQVKKGKENAFTVVASSATDKRKDIFDMSVAQKWTLLEMHATHASLEDVFRQLTAN